MRQNVDIEWPQSVHDTYDEWYETTFIRTDDFSPTDWVLWADEAAEGKEQ